MQEKKAKRKYTRRKKVIKFEQESLGLEKKEEEKKEPTIKNRMLKQNTLPVGETYTYFGPYIP